MQDILSFDCGYTTMAYIKFKLNTNILIELKTLSDEIRDAKIVDAILANEYLSKIEAMLASFIVVEKYDVVDILGKKVSDTTSQERAIAVKTFVNTINTRETDFAPIVFIESQPAKVGKFAHNQSGVVAIENQLTYAFSDYEIHLVSPKIKNNIYFADNLELSNFETTNATRGKDQQARKKHTTANMLHLFKIFNIDSTLVKKGKLNHVADAFMQVLASLTITRDLRIVI